MSDEIGLLEEFTNDLTDFVQIDVSHLSSDGLAKVGTVVRPGLLLMERLEARRWMPSLRK
jgi:hypothetical protein